MQVGTLINSQITRTKSTIRNVITGTTGGNCFQNVHGNSPATKC